MGSFQRKNSLILVDFSKWPQELLLSDSTLATKQTFISQNMEILYTLIKFIINTVVSFIGGLRCGLSKHEM